MCDLEDYLHLKVYLIGNDFDSFLDEIISIFELRKRHWARNMAAIVLIEWNSRNTLAIRGRPHKKVNQTKSVAEETFHDLGRQEIEKLEKRFKINDYKLIRQVDKRLKVVSVYTQNGCNVRISTKRSKWNEKWAKVWMKSRPIWPKVFVCVAWKCCVGVIRVARAIWSKAERMKKSFELCVLVQECNWLPQSK